MTPIDVLCSNFVNFGQREIGEIIAYLKKNFAWLCSYRYCADRTQNLPRPAPDNVLDSAADFIQISPLAAKL